MTPAGPTASKHAPVPPTSLGMLPQGDVLAPAAPRDLAATGLDDGFLADVPLKTAHPVPRCTIRAVADRLRLPLPLVDGLLQDLSRDHLLEVLGHEGPFNHRHALSARGHERVLRLLKTSGYVGPAPVSLDAYADMVCY